jgi:hypothetical protein
VVVVDRCAREELARASSLRAGEASGGSVEWPFHHSVGQTTKLLSTRIGVSANLAAIVRQNKQRSCWRVRRYVVGVFYMPVIPLCICKLLQRSVQCGCRTKKTRDRADCAHNKGQACLHATRRLLRVLHLQTSYFWKSCQALV